MFLITQIPRHANISKIKHMHTHVQDKDHANECAVAAANLSAVTSQIH